MKKAIGFTIIFSLFLLIYQFVVIFLESGHEISYKIESNDKVFRITESYLKDKDIDGYYIKVNADNKDYNFFVKNKYNKQKKIITDIKYIEQDGYICMYPVSVKKDINVDIVCSYNDTYYNAQYVMKKTNIDSFIKEFEDINNYKFVDGNSSKKTDFFYKDNIDTNEYVALYKYNSFDVFHGDKTKRVALYFKDVYVNELGSFLDFYYLAPNISTAGETDEYLLVNLKDATSRIIYLDRKFSTNSYNLGVVNHKLYVFDLEYKIEYEFDTYGNCNIVGDPKKGYRFYENGKWESVPVTKFTESKSIFANQYDVPFQYDEIYDAIEFYYVIRDNNLYKVYKNDLKTEIYLYNIGTHSNTKAFKNNLYYIKDGAIYKFNKYGNRIIAYDNELRYNTYSNMYYVFYE